MFALESRTDQLFRTAVLLTPHRKVADTQIDEYGCPAQDEAVERSARHVEAYVIQRREDEDFPLAIEEPEEETHPIPEALEKVADLAGKLWVRLRDTLVMWGDFCDLAHQRDRGETISTASMVALESPYVISFAEDIGLPVSDAAGRLSRLHGLFCPTHPHKPIPQLILTTLPNLGYFL